MQRSVRRLVPPTVVPAAVRQLAAVALVGALGTSVLAAAAAGPAHGVSSSAQVQPAGSGPSVAAAQAPRELPHAERVPSTAGAAAGAPAGVSAAAAAATPAASAHRRSPRPVAHTPARVVRRSPRLVRWLPTGTGMWIYEWKKTAHGRPATVVAHARRIGLTTLFVRTGSSHDGYRGDPLLRALLPATRHTNVHVVTWDFPELKHPAADARRLARTAWYNRQVRSWPHVAAVAPDIETRAEGARSSARNVVTYLTTLRRLLPRDVAILSTVPWPSHARRGHYPYATVAARSDALLPMAYWYNNPPQLVTARSMAYLRQFHRPVQPVGQGYDGKIDVPSLPHNNLKKQVPAFFATAHKMGASAVSLWSWQAAPRAAWLAISRYRGWFAPQAARRR